MTKKIFIAIFTVSCSILIVSGFFIVRVLYKNFEKVIDENLKTEAAIIETVLKTDKNFFSEIMPHILNHTTTLPLRITVIQSDGSIIYESNGNFAIMGNHLERDEIQQALKTGDGTAKRLSNTFNEKFYYYAKRLDDGSVLRIATKQDALLKIFISNMPVGVLVILVLLLVVTLASILLAKKIVQPINAIDVNDIKIEKQYNEIKPFLTKIIEQKEQLQKDKKELQRAELIRKDFTSNVTHELKTPLQTISGYAELIKTGIANETDIKPFAEKIFAESFRMRNLVDDIIELSQMEIEHKQYKTENANIFTIAQNVVDSLSFTAQEKNVSLHIEGGCTDTPCIAKFVHTIIYNLVDNAIKYNKPSGSVYVTVTQQEHVTVQVADTGIGIEAENLERIFERFYRVDKSRSKQIGGTGLGLAIVKHACINCNAQISVESEFDSGTTFTVVFF